MVESRYTKYSGSFNKLPKLFVAWLKKKAIHFKDRSLKEIEDTKELYELLMKIGSGVHLSNLEKATLKVQIRNICKAIPVLTIFLLPFGGIMLFFVYKFISPHHFPNLLNDLNHLKNPFSK